MLTKAASFVVLGLRVGCIEPSGSSVGAMWSTGSGVWAVWVSVVVGLRCCGAGAASATWGQHCGECISASEKLRTHI